MIITVITSPVKWHCNIIWCHCVTIVYYLYTNNLLTGHKHTHTTHTYTHRHRHKHRHTHNTHTYAQTVEGGDWKGQL